MPGKPPGSLVGLYYEAWRGAEEGDYIRTGTGRLYLVQSVRIQERGKHAGRQHLKCVVMDPSHEPEPDASILPLYWYKR